MWGRVEETRWIVLKRDKAFECLAIDSRDIGDRCRWMAYVIETHVLSNCAIDRVELILL